MIHSVSANKASFHRVEFGPGLNIVLAERTKASTRKDTRNGLGKSMLVDIIDFCLGSNPRKGKGLRIEPLLDWEFTLDVTLARNRVKVIRAIRTPNRVVVEGPTTDWIEQPDIDEETGERVFKLDRWKALLGWAMFGVSRTNDAYKYNPSYRSLISYFIRREVISPFQHTRKQSTWDIQLHIGFLLGLNWEYASKWQELKDQRKAIEAINAAIKTGVMEIALGSVGELEADRIQLESQFEREAESLRNFKVHPQYEAIQEEADRLTAEIHALANQNITVRRRLSRYQESISAEKTPSDAAIDKIYEEAGMVFPNSVQRTLAEAKEFHIKIIEHRKAFLESEIKRLESEIEKREDEIKKLTEARAIPLEILDTHGAWHEMTKLRERHVETQERLSRVCARISEIKEFNSQKRDIKIARAELTRLAEQDHHQRQDLWSIPVRIFNANSLALYETPGRLVIDIDETGFRYDVEIDKSDSEGVGKMKIFCFDLMLLEFFSYQKNRMNFLVHDSTLYDAVDSRQRALALERASEVLDSTGCQYICTINSDMVPREDFSEDFNFNSFVRLTLTDKTPSGSLFGFRFERPRK